MPKQDGSLTGADHVALGRALNRMIPSEDPQSRAGTLGISRLIEERATREKGTRSAFLRVIEALALDPTAHAVGGFAAMTGEQQTDALLNIERALPGEFSIFLEIVRDVYYQDDRTPGRPENFDDEAEVFGKATEDADADQARRPATSRRHST
jgi:hypothetical protein